MPDKDIYEIEKIIAAEQQKRIEPVSEERRKEIANKLPSLYKILHKNHEFKEGQIVEWKEGLKNRSLPRLREPAIIMNILECPEFDTERDSGSPYFREPLDMIIGVIDEIEGMLICFHVDKRRFKPFEG